MRTWSVLLLMAALVGSASAEVGVSLTIYNENLALVRDVRMMDFKNGVGEVLFRDVSGQIDATSVHFKAPGVNMLEQNFDYDLVSPDKLLQKYTDQQIEVMDEKGNIVRGILLSFGTGTSGNQIVLKQDDGSLRSLLLEKVADIRYPSLPAGLITRPTLRWLVDAGSSGKKETEVAYLTGGMSWQASYVMVLNEANDHSDLDAWVTINNSCGSSYENAKLKLIAGEPNRVREPMPLSPRGAGFKAMAETADRQFEEKSFFEYHLYTLQRPATVLNNQTKQISLFPSTAFGVKKVYEYDPQSDNDKVGVSVEFENREANGLGIALPAGTVRVYQKDSDGSQQFVGEDRIEHTPRDEKMTVRVGKVFDVAVERDQMDYRQISDRVRETDYQVKIRNHKKETIEIKVVDHLWGDWEITKSSLPSKKVTAQKLEFPVSCEPDKEVILTYTVRQR